MSALKDQFNRDGYVVARQLLSPDEVQTYRDLLGHHSGLDDSSFRKDFASSGGWSKPDGVTSTSDFWPLIFNERLLEVVRDTLGPDARYTQHSDLHVHVGSVGWHRDSAHRTFGEGPDWDESRAPYLIARVAIYLQSYGESGSALGVIPGTHRQDKKSKRAAREVERGTKLLRILRIKERLPPLPRTRPVWIKTEPGDCVVFNQRLLHSGNRIHGPKYAIFLSYGAPNEHAHNHRRYYIDDRQDLGYGDYPTDLADRLREAELYLEKT